MKDYLKKFWILNCLLIANTAVASDWSLLTARPFQFTNSIDNEFNTQEDIISNFKSNLINFNPINHNAYTHDLLNNSTLNSKGIKLMLINNAINHQNTWHPQIYGDMQTQSDQDNTENVIQPNPIKYKGINLYSNASKHYQEAIFGKKLQLSTTLQTVQANTLNDSNAINLQQLSQNVRATIKLSDEIYTTLEYQNNSNATLNTKTIDTDFFITWLTNQTLSLTGAYINLNNLNKNQHQNTWYQTGKINY